MAKLISVGFWQGLEFAAEEEDSGAVVLEVAETSGRGFQGLDATVKAFRGRVADPVVEPGHDPLEVTLNHLGHLNHRLKAAAAGPTVLLLEIGSRGVWPGLIPEVAEGPPDRPRAGGFQVRVSKFLEARQTLLREMFGIRQPQVATPF